MQATETVRPMKSSGRRFFSFSSQKHDSGAIYGHSTNYDLSQVSTYTDDSSIDRSNLHSSKSFSSAAREVAGAFTTCFHPRRRKDERTAAPEDGKIQATDVSSASSSRVSTLTGSSISKLEYSGSNHAALQEITKFSIEEIRKATGNFAMENIIGQGRFGTVYKGKLKNGFRIAVKRAKKNKYDMRLSTEFKNELDTLAKVEHLNLVRFLGYLDHADEGIIVLEYVGNGTLREHLDGLRGDGLEIAERLDIAIDVAHAVAYLHMYTDHPIIHRDIKPSNILLTENLRAKVADFGFARLGAEDPEATHISTQVKGTAGYVDPEYIRTYQLTDKSDVYSFGVLLVELVTGRHPIERHRERRDRVTTRWAVQRYREGDAVIAMDTRLRRSPASVMAVEQMMGLAVECMAPSRGSRPSMKKCAEVLWRIRRDFREMQLSSTAKIPPSERSVGTKSIETNEVVSLEKRKFKPTERQTRSGEF